MLLVMRRLDSAHDRSVIAFRAAAGEEYLIRLGIDKRGDVFARRLNIPVNLSPNVCMLEGLPYRSVRNGIIASVTSAQSVSSHCYQGKSRLIGPPRP